MRFFILFVVLVVSGQNLGQISGGQSDLTTKDVPGRKSLESLLIDRARTIYGTDVVKTVLLTTRRPLPVASGSRPSQEERTLDSAFDDENSPESTKPMSYKGDIASGVILLEEKDALYLDVTPCRAKSSVFIFHPPFAKKRVGMISCNGQDVERYLIAQR